MQASLRGASEIGFTVISLTVSLIAVFIPLLFMSGLVGRMFREFALTLTIAVVTSAIVSLTLTPMMCSRLLQAHRRGAGGPGPCRASAGFIDRTVDFYHRTLLWVLQRQRATLLVTLATLAATLVLYVVAPKGFLPLQDTASITAVTEAGPDVSFAEMQKPADPGGERDQGRSRRHRRRLGDRRGLGQPDHQCRPAGDDAEAARRAARRRRRGHRRG